MCETVYKVLIIGDPQVGKTSMVARYCYRDWMQNYKATIGADYAVKGIKWSDTETVRLHIWDIAGQDTYRAMTRTYYRGASGCIVMFDLTDRKSFEQAKTWKKDLDEKVHLPNGECLPAILVGNKDDLVDKIVVSNHEMSKLAREMQFAESITTSVKQNRNVTEAFCQLIQHMLDQENAGTIVEQLPDDSVADLNGVVKLGKHESHHHQSRAGCCPTS